jgi:ubiquinone biosynthesis protein Coq4
MCLHSVTALCRIRFRDKMRGLFRHGRSGKAIATVQVMMSSSRSSFMPMSLPLSTSTKKTEVPFYGHPRSINDEQSSWKGLLDTTTTTTQTFANIPLLSPRLLTTTYSFFDSTVTTPVKSALNRFYQVILQGTTAIADPTRADAVAAIGELSGRWALLQLRQCMMDHPVGRQILQDKPLVNQALVDQLLLQQSQKSDKISNGTFQIHPDDDDADDDIDLTFGQAYIRFLHRHGFNPDDRDPIHYMKNDDFMQKNDCPMLSSHDENESSDSMLLEADLSYIMLRYRQCHDYWHTITNLPPTVSGELGLKWLELFQTKLPLAAFAVTVGSLSLFSSQPALSFNYQQVNRKDNNDSSLKTKDTTTTTMGVGWNDLSTVWNVYRPWAIEMSGSNNNNDKDNNNNNSKSRMSYGMLLCVYYEKEFATPLVELRKRLNITPAPKVASTPRS